MAWNEPGGNKEQDPWRGKNNQQMPPDLDEVLKNLRKRIAKLFGFTLKPAGVGAGNNQTSKIAALITLLAAVIWAAMGVFIVSPAERAVILQFGKYKEIVGPGIHWMPLLVQSRSIVNEQKIDNYSYQAQMLTKDENIVSVAVAVQYRIQDAKDYLFNVVSPTQSLRQATASALRQVVGQSTLDDILTKGRDQVRQAVEEQLNRILAQYNTGILITAVAMQPASAPDAVKDAFDDAIKAQEDEQRFVNQAQAYAMQVEPIAKGQAQRIAQEATAYKEQVVLKAKGDAARFLALLPEYQRAPEVTKQRLYIDMMEKLLSHTTKIYVDTKANNNLLYLPLDKIIPSANKERLVTQENTLNPSDVAAQPSEAQESSTSDLLEGYGYPRGGYYGRRS